MTVTYHRAENFRNIKEIEILPHNEMNIIYGENGQGKTNLIESIWMMTGFHSFRTNKNNQLIKSDEDIAKINSEFFSGEREQKAKIEIGQKKELELNFVKEESVRIMMQRFPAVVFSPATLAAVQQGPGERRKLIDIALSLIKPNYASVMSQYLKVVKNRNAMLREYNEKCFSLPYFNVWNEQFINLGAKIIDYRLKYIEKLNEISALIYKGISSDKEKLKINYNFSKNQLSFEEILKLLEIETEKSKEADIKRLYTNCGPHTHDLNIILNDKNASLYASQGQQRSCALSIKLAEAQIIKSVTDENPVVLLDDVMSELDEGRQNYILNVLDNRQVFITCCDPSQMMRGKKGKIFKIENGGLVC